MNGLRIKKMKMIHKILILKLLTFWNFTKIRNFFIIINKKINQKNPNNNFHKY